VITFIRVIQGLLIVLSSQAIVVAAVMIGIIIYINIMQRSKEIGVMKAVGYQNRDVKGIFIYEAIWIVGIALLLAFLVAQGVGSLANAVVNHFYPSITKVFKKETNIEKQCPYLQLNLNSYIIGLLKGDL